jgi:glycosyltransferase involved in cell wall biosynthesis
MAVYNAARFLREAVDSILSQTYDDFELIVVDDSSSDTSLSIARAIGDDRIQIIAHADNQGAARSRNDAMVAARGEFIAIMDADDVSSPFRLERQVGFLDTHPKVGLVGCGVYDNIDVDGSVLYTSYLPLDNETIQKTLVERWCFLHPSIMFRKALLDRVGGYRPEFDVAEDHDFILRLLEHSEARNLEERLVSYRINPKGLSVVGHEYINELGAVAMRLAQERRQGHQEDLDGELQRSVWAKRRPKAAGAITNAIHRWQDTRYAANRFYGFGCRELYAGNLRQARRCFWRSIRTNGFFAKSWLCLILSFVPFALDHLRFVFRSSRQQHEERARLRRSAVTSGT